MKSSPSGSGPVLGVIWPDDGGDALDYEVLRLAPWLAARGRGEVRVMIERSIAGRQHTRADLLRTGRDGALEPPARRLVEGGASVIAWACTSGSFIGGLEWSRSQALALQRKTGLPVTSATLALIDAARALGAERVDLLGAYPPEVTAAFAGCLRAAGIEVSESHALGCPDGSASFRLDLVAELVAFVRRVGPRSSPILLPDTAINTLDYLEKFEDIAGRPVVTANQAVVWRSLALLGGKPIVRGAGTLFRVPCSVAA